MSGSSEQASKSRTKTSALTQARYRLNTVFQLPKKAGRSRHGLPVRAIHSTASTKRRLSLPLRPGRSEEHTSELQSLMRISYAVFCLKKKKKKKQNKHISQPIIKNTNT